MIFQANTLIMKITSLEKKRHYCEVLKKSFIPYNTLQIKIPFTPHKAGLRLRYEFTKYPILLYKGKVLPKCISKQVNN